MFYFNVDPKKDYMKDLVIENNIIKPSREMWDNVFNNVLNISQGYSLANSTNRDTELYTIKDLTQEEIDELIQNGESVPLNFIDINKKLQQDYAEFSNGLIYSYNIPGLYYKLPSNLSIAKENGQPFANEIHPLYTIFKMSDRGKAKLSILHIYINGIKVPDEEVYGFMSEDKTDILIPKRYVYLNRDTLLKPGDNIIYIEKKTYSQYTYVNRYSSNFSGNQVTLTLSTDELDNNFFGRPNSKDMMLVFINGKFVHPTAYRALTNPNSSNQVLLIINPDITYSNVTLELIFDSTIKFSKTITTVQKDKHLLWIDENVTSGLNTIHGVIPKENCLFFVDENRISSKLTAQVGRYNYTASVINTPSSIATILMTDKNLIQNALKYIYSEDYYVANMVGNKATSYLFEGIDNLTDEQKSEISAYMLNSGLPFEEILTNKNFLYNFEKLLSEHEIFNIIPTFYERIKTLLKLPYNFSLLRNYLNFFGKQEIYDDIFVTQNQLLLNQYIEYSFDEKIEENLLHRFDYLIEVNGKHIMDTQFEVIQIDAKWVIRISTDTLQVGTNYIHILKLKENLVDDYVEIKICSKTDIVNNELIIDTLSSVKFVDDYICLIPTVDGNRYILNPEIEDGPYKGWTLFNDIHFVLNEDGTTTITFDDSSVLPDIICIYSTRFKLTTGLIDFGKEKVFKFEKTEWVDRLYDPRGKLPIIAGEDENGYGEENINIYQMVSRCNFLREKFGFSNDIYISDALPDADYDNLLSA